MSITFDLGILTLNLERKEEKLKLTKVELSDGLVCTGIMAATPYAITTVIKELSKCETEDESIAGSIFLFGSTGLAIPQAIGYCVFAKKYGKKVFTPLLIANILDSVYEIGKGIYDLLPNEPENNQVYQSNIKDKLESTINA